MLSGLQLGAECGIYGKFAIKSYVPHFEKTKTDFAVSSGVEDTYGRDYWSVTPEFEDTIFGMVQNRLTL
jgi:hypothetical protein